MSELYNVLGVPRNASYHDIEQSYLKLSKDLHSGQQPGAAEIFKEISFAYETLSDPKKRPLYDRYGLEGVQESSDQINYGGGFMSDLFESPFASFAEPMGFGGFGGFCGFGGLGVRSRPQCGREEFYILKVTLEDLYNGNVKNISVGSNLICNGCNGVGCSERTPCRGCAGSGNKWTFYEIAQGITVQGKAQCNLCDGKGEMTNEKFICTICKGKKVLYHLRNLDVNVDKGMKDTQRILLKGETEQYPGPQTGDLVVILEQKVHDVFHRSGDNLYLTKTIGLAEALCGLNIVVRHLDGRDLIITHPPGCVIKPDDVKGVSGEGMPVYRKPFKKGNLYVKFDITFPEDNFTNEKVIQTLLSMFPPKAPIIIPKDAEEVELEIFDPNYKTESHVPRASEAYASDDDEGPEMQCAHQ